MIKILSKELTNQISAGEIIDRPASIVKELIENSLDAKSTMINIDIMHGGILMILVSDNGCGIIKEELSLALTNHATSKISKIDDLQKISSLGFRGEALASINSVSELTLISRPYNQDQAWQTCEEYLEPVAHPIGTTVKVKHLFYNTPVRRKFLKSEKTEFLRIDEVIRQLALSRLDVTFIVRHNKKIIRQYHAVINSKIKRLNNLCGSFIKKSLEVSCHKDDMKVKGWIINPNDGSVLDINYLYVNNRIIRDKLINHAIRQAYFELSTNVKHPSFILFINLPTDQIDINIHPSKNEVRFYQERIIHDFIYKSICTTLRDDINKNNDITTTSNTTTSKKSLNNNTVTILHKKTDIPTISHQYNYKILSIYLSYYALIEYYNKILVISLLKAKRYFFEYQLINKNKFLYTKPLIIPYKCNLSEKHIIFIKKYYKFFKIIGIEIKFFDKLCFIKKIPKLLDQQNLHQFIFEFINYIFNKKKIIFDKIISWIIDWVIVNHNPWDKNQVISLFQEIEKIFPNWMNNCYGKFAIAINIDTAISYFNDD